MKPERRSNWLVLVTETVSKVIRCENCTRYQAWHDPYEYATNETELWQDDFEVLGVEEETP